MTDPMLVDGRCVFRLHASMALIDPRGRLLMVQEEKPVAHGKWNLPGGHVDHGESPQAAGSRETLEETHIACMPSSLLGVYTTRWATRFVFEAINVTASAIAGDQIIGVQWFELDEVLALPPESLVAPGMSRQIIQDLRSGRRFPLETLTHIV